MRLIIQSNTSLHHVINEDIILKDGASVSLHGITNGIIHLTDNTCCKLHGIHNGKIIVDKGCTLYAHGTLIGQLECHGHTDIWGIAKICDTISDENSITIHKHAIVNDTTYSADKTI